MEGVGDQELDVVDAGPGGPLEDVLEDAAPDVRGLHLGERQGDVVEGNGQPHPAVQQGGERLGAVGVVQRPVDGGVDVLDPRERLGRVDDPAAEGEPLEAEPLTLMEQQRWGPLVHLQHKARSTHTCSSPSSKHPSEGRRPP